MSNYIVDYVIKKLRLWPSNTPDDILYELHKKVMDHLESKIQTFLDNYPQKHRNYTSRSSEIKNELLPPDLPQLDPGETYILAMCYNDYFYYKKARTDIKLRFLTLVCQLGGDLSRQLDYERVKITNDYTAHDHLNPPPNPNPPPPAYCAV